MRIIGYSAIVVTMTASLPAAGFAAEPLFFPFELQAQQHCPGDTVVWADAALHLYNVKGERWYGNTRTGAYMCLRDGQIAGFRPRRNVISATPE